MSPKKLIVCSVTNEERLVGIQQVKHVVVAVGTKLCTHIPYTQVRNPNVSFQSPNLLSDVQLFDWSKKYCILLVVINLDHKWVFSSTVIIGQAEMIWSIKFDHLMVFIRSLPHNYNWKFFIQKGLPSNQPILRTYIRTGTYIGFRRKHWFSSKTRLFNLCFILAHRRARWNYCTWIYDCRYSQVKKRKNPMPFIVLATSQNRNESWVDTLGYLHR